MILQSIQTFISPMIIFQNYRTISIKYDLLSLITFPSVSPSSLPFPFSPPSPSHSLQVDSANHNQHQFIHQIVSQCLFCSIHAWIDNDWRIRFALVGNQACSNVMIINAVQLLHGQLFSGVKNSNIVYYVIAALKSATYMAYTQSQRKYFTK